MLRKFVEKTPALVSIIVLPTILWSIIYLIELSIGHFIPLQIIGVLAGISGVLIGHYVNYVKNS